MTRCRQIVSLLILILGTPFAALGAEETLDFSEQMTPRCELAMISVSHPAGWFNVPFQDPPDGHLGCQMMRTNEDEELEGVLRVRSATDPAPEYGDPGYTPLIANEMTAFEMMGCTLGDSPLWVREDVPVSGEDFREGKAVAIPCTLEGNEVLQELHILAFRGPSAKYLVSLLTPEKKHDESIYKKNLAGFETVLQTLQPDEQ